MLDVVSLATLLNQLSKISVMYQILHADKSRFTSKTKNGKEPLLTQAQCDNQWRSKVVAGSLLSHTGFILAPRWSQRLARVHWTPCTPYCYATGDNVNSLI